MDALRNLGASRAHHMGVAMLMSVLILLSCTAPAALAAYQSVTDPVYFVCNASQFSSNDSFAANFNAVNESLILSSSQTLYSSASSQSGSESSYVFGIYQCRGDVSFSDCSLCVVTILSSVFTICQNQPRGVYIQTTGCSVRYENYPFASGLDHAGSFHKLCSPLHDSSRVYQHNIRTALNSTASAAPKHALFGYNASSAGTGSSTTAYALSQCLGYLSRSECTTCLTEVSNYSEMCGNSVSGRVYFVACYYLYGNVSLLFTYSTSTAGTTDLPPSSSSHHRSPISSPPEDRSRNQSRNTTPIIIGMVVGVFSGIATTVALAVCCLKRRKKATILRKAVQGPLHGAARGSDPVLITAGATRFSLKELGEATHDFDPRNKLGEGGFGPVFRGTLRSGREVAIKMLSAKSHQGNTQFINEVTLITKVQHRNFVQLIGYCAEDCKRLLVYEHLPNRSLDLHLFDNAENEFLRWRTRFKIIMGIARGLAYLHQDSNLRIVHRDIKASNILLDNNLNPKIADFGLAKLFGDDMTHLTTGLVGTLGYLSPEYAVGGQLSEKVDVYSFGVVALEIVSGRRVIDNKMEADEHNLLEWTWALYEKKQQVQIVDKRMRNDNVNEGEVVRVVHVALLCTQSKPRSRPRMSDVYGILNRESTILDLPTKPISMQGMSAVGLSLSASMPSSISKFSGAESSFNADPSSEIQPR